MGFWGVRLQSRKSLTVHGVERGHKWVEPLVGAMCDVMKHSAPHICTCICIGIDSYIYRSIYMHMNIYICMYVCMHACMYVCGRASQRTPTGSHGVMW